MKLFTGSVTATLVLFGLGAFGWICGRGPSGAVVHAANGGPSVTVEGPLPLPVTTTATQPIQITRFGQTNAPGINLVLYVVPAGKRLIVEHFSSEAVVASGTTLDRYALNVANNPQDPGTASFSHFIPASAPPCGTCAIVATQPIRMYVEAGQALVANVGFTGVIGPTASVFVSVSGYLVNA
ncbi:MAG TPA: hypothetical protein VH639_28690 [Bryobacteraceae bacterium]|jgi:hypothetical protein